MLQSGHGKQDGWTDGRSETNIPPNNFVVWGVELQEHGLLTAYHVHIWQVLPQHCFSESCQTSICGIGFNWYVCKIGKKSLIKIWMNKDFMTNALVYLEPTLACPFNTLRVRQNGLHFADDYFKCIFLNKNVLILIEISLKFVTNGIINNTLALVQIMAWQQPGDKPISEPMMVRLPMHIWVTQPQWVNLKNRI